MMSKDARTWFGLKSPASAAFFEAMYQEQLPRVYNFFRYRFGDNALAEDLTAQTFEKAWKNRLSYRRDLAAFSTWLFTIARRVAIDAYRQARPEAGLEAAEGLALGGSLEEQAQHSSDLRRLNAALRGLPPRERELVALKYGADLSQREIARLTELSESNVGVILFRTIQTLRKDWESNHEG